MKKCVDTGTTHKAIFRNGITLLRRRLSRAFVSILKLRCPKIKINEAFPAIVGSDSESFCIVRYAKVLCACRTSIWDSRLRIWTWCNTNRSCDESSIAQGVDAKQDGTNEASEHQRFCIPAAILGSFVKESRGCSSIRVLWRRHVLDGRVSWSHQP